MECARHKGTGTEWAMAYVAGTLEPEEQIALDRHMAECQGCRDIVAEQRAVWEAMDAWKPAPISADFDARLSQRISQESSVSWWRRLLHVDWTSIWRPAVPVAAACIVLVIAFLVKAPATAPNSPPQKVSIEQVERALDDMDMLKQINLPAPAEGQPAERI